MRYWLGVASKDHVALGVAGGFCQLCHGKKAPLQRMRRGDHILYYSPKQEFRSCRPCQAITACGVVTGDEVYQYEMFPGFVPYRRDIEWQTPVREVPLDCPAHLTGLERGSTKAALRPRGASARAVPGNSGVHAVGRRVAQNAVNELPPEVDALPAHSLTGSGLG